MSQIATVDGCPVFSRLLPKGCGATHTVFFRSDIHLNVDGSPRAYGPGKLGQDYLASAVRHIHGPQEALRVLAQVANRFPESGAILYDLARYAAQLGRVAVARARLAEAIKLAPEYRQNVLDDPDLAPLWNHSTLGGHAA